MGGFLGLLLDPEATPAQCEEAGVEAVRRAVELGVRYFDTSPATAPPSAISPPG